MDQSAARNVALEGTEISRDHTKFVAVARAERSKSPEGLQNFTRKKEAAASRRNYGSFCQSVQSAVWLTNFKITSVIVSAPLIEPYIGHVFHRSKES